MTKPFMLAASDHDFLHVLFLTFDSRGLAETTEGAELDEMLELVKKDPGGHFLEACEKLCIWSMSLPASRFRDE